MRFGAGRDGSLSDRTQGDDMAVNERTRHALHEAARRTLGGEEAVTLMELLPPAGWADVATKHDLELRLDALETRFVGELQRQVNRLLMWLVPTVFAGLAVGVTLAERAG
jgi:hypothetical protein